MTHLEEVVALLRASVGQLWMCAAQISLEEKAAFEDPDDPTPSAAAQSGSAGIPASSPLFLGRFWTTGHGRATEQGPPAQCRASRLAEACWAPCRLAWPHSAALQPEASSSLLSQVSNPHPTLQNPHACSCSFSPCFHRSFFP